MQVAAMHDPIGRAMPLGDPTPQRKRRDLAGLGGVENPERVGRDGAGAQMRRRAEPLQDTRAVGADLDGTEVGIQYYKSIIALTVELLMRDKIHIDERREQKINQLLKKDDKV